MLLKTPIPALTIYLLQRLSITLKLNLVYFFDQKLNKNKLEGRGVLPLYLIKSLNLLIKVC